MQEWANQLCLSAHAPVSSRDSLVPVVLELRESPRWGPRRRRDRRAAVRRPVPLRVDEVRVRLDMELGFSQQTSGVVLRSLVEARWTVNLKPSCF
ncbi:Hypothetical protein SMAX5B_016569 [Scophthalmus maximus]|uniref:Uncharacterized protein n=1 Tax=Scophthalmus maximus TaxID=52904 RepID=A0A2U9BU20_SCOMX|nr:Hypothetical protein SMAX5B_016569 [Scophthalmus maximus]